MASTQFRSDDTEKWTYGFGSGVAGDGSINTSTDAPIDSACSGTATLPRFEGAAIGQNYSI